MIGKKKNKKDWSDIKLYQLQEIYTLPEYDDKIDLMVNVLSILLDKDVDDIENMVVDDIFKIYDEWSFIQTPPKEKQVPIIKVDGKRYGMIDLNKLTLAQYADIEEYLSEGEVFDNIHRVLSVLYLPVKKYNYITKKYELEEYEPNEEREQMFKTVSMDVLYPVILFFYHIVKDYLIDLQHSLVQMKKEELMTMIYQEETLSEEQKNDIKKKLEESGI